MTATDQLIVALAGLIVAISSILPVVAVAIAHYLQSKQVAGNSAKLDAISESTNGTMTAMRAELASVRAELAASRDAHPS